MIDVLEQKGGRLLTPNIRENQVSWAYDLDSPVEDFEQLIFIANHGLDKLLGEVERHGYSTEQLDISFGLRNKTERAYEIKTSFPTLEKNFWLKLINLRIALDPPEAGIMSVKIISYFTRPRPAQAGLYAVSRPDPEALLLTVNKLKKLAGEENVGVPALVDQRLEQGIQAGRGRYPRGQGKGRDTRLGRDDRVQLFHAPGRGRGKGRETAAGFSKNRRSQWFCKGIQRRLAAEFALVEQRVEDRGMGRRAGKRRRLPALQGGQKMVSDGGI